MLGCILGIALAEGNGLNVAFLPDGVSPDVAYEIVDMVNAIAPDTGIAHAILISGKAEGGLSTNDALQYRQDDRLAVVLGRHSDIGSFSHSFTEVLGPNYPDGRAAPLDFETLAGISATHLLKDQDIDGADVRPLLADTLAKLFKKVEELQQAIGQGTVGWNSLWYAHVDRGLENLAAALATWTGGSDEPLLENLCFSSFGLPTPMRPARRVLTGRDLAAAFVDHWNDTESCRASASLLDTASKSSGGMGHPMADVDLDDMAAHLAVLDNSPLAFATMVRNDAAFARALASTTEREFAAPAGALDQAEIEVFTRAGQDTSVFTDDQNRANPKVILLSDDRLGETMVSEDITLRIPTVKPVDQDLLDRSGLRIIARPTNRVRWNGKARRHAGGFALDGNLELKTNRNKVSAAPQKVTLTVEVSAQDPLIGFLPSRSMTTVIHGVFPEIGGMWTFALKNGKVSGRPNYAGPESADLDNLEALEGAYNEPLPKVGDEVCILAWTDSGAVEVEAEQLPEVEGRPGLFLGRSGLAERIRVTFDSHEVNLEIQDSRPAPRSPIIAAMAHLRSAEPELTDAERLTVRGAYEQWVSEKVSATSDSPESSSTPLLSWSLRSNADQDTSGMQYSSKRATFIPGDSHDWEKSWPNHVTVDPQFLASAAVRDFMAAFNDILDISGFRDMASTFTLSTYSWRELFSERHALDRYLEAYANLVEASRHQPNDYVKMWAAYPFSVFIWDTDSGGGCSAVLLSPLHPIRLAWLAAVEQTLGDADNAEALATSVEGWDFPMFGPREQGSVQMISVPTEYGEDQLFIGWSMLLAVQQAVATPISSPEMAGGLRLPGGTASGLDAASVKSTIRNLRKVNPHLSTLTVDLSASSESNRLESIDTVVIDQIEEWIRDRDLPLFGGARVWDSSNRLGNIPRAEVERLMENDSAAPVSWSRYRHDPATTRFSNLRVLQDGGVKVFWEGFNPAKKSPATGLVGHIPLRRFELSLQSSLNGHQSVSSPTLVDSEGNERWKAFDAAVRMIEDSPSNLMAPVIVSEIDAGALANERSDWTVAGESFMNPSDMARLVTQQGEMDRMMWEWKPPFLQDLDDEAALERRPFVSIARVPQHLRTRLESTINSVFRGDDSSELVTDLMSTLGSKGVGLSAMLSMGGTHVSGAIGFYLVYKLMEQVRRTRSLTVVLPIDACDAFLRVLGDGASTEPDAARRADLLLIDLSETTVTLSPIEIKAYGLGAAHSGGLLPTTDGHEMTEALGQLATTEAILNRIVERWSDLNSDGDSASAALWNNGLATLVESAIRLNPISDDELEAARKAMDGLAFGTSQVRVGTPVVAYFKHDAYAPGGKAYFHGAGPRRVHDDDHHFALFAANPEEVLGAISAEDGYGSDLVQAWAQTVNLAVSGPTSDRPIRDSRDEAGSLPHPTAAKKCENSTRNPSSTPGVTTGKSEASTSGTIPERPTPVSRCSTHDSRSHPPQAAPASRLQGPGVPLAMELTDDPGRENDPEPEHGDAVRFTVGTSHGGRRKATFWPSNTNLNQLNIGIAGDLGTGKTQLLKSLLFNLRQPYLPGQPKPPSILIFDYKRDFQEEDFLDCVGGQVLDLYRMPVNFFDLGNTPYTPIAAVQKAGQFLSVLEKIYSGIGPKQRQKFTDAVKSLFKDAGGVAPLLPEVLARYSNNGKDVDSLTAIMSQFVDMEVFSEDRSTIRPFADLLDDKTLVLAVNQLGTDDNAKNSLVTLFLNMYYQYMIDSSKPKFFGDDVTMRTLSSFLVIDEAVNVLQYNFPVLMSLLLQGREFGFGIILSTQYLRHFKQGPENYAEPLLTWFIHKVPQTTPKDLQALGFSASAAAELAPVVSSLEKHYSVYRSHGHPGEVIEDLPFYKLVVGRS